MKIRWTAKIPTLHGCVIEGEFDHAGEDDDICIEKMVKMVEISILRRLEFKWEKVDELNTE